MLVYKQGSSIFRGHTIVDTDLATIMPSDISIADPTVKNLPIRLLPDPGSVLNLYINGTDITDFQDISLLSNLTSLSIINSKATTFPDIFDKLPKMAMLNFRRSNFTALPKNLPKLQRLYFMDISDSKITAIPEGFKDHPAMTINFSNTQLRTLYPLRSLSLRSYLTEKTVQSLPKEVYDVGMKCAEANRSACDTLENFYRDSIEDIADKLLKGEKISNREHIRLCHEGRDNDNVLDIIITKLTDPRISDNLLDCIMGGIKSD